MGEAGSNDDICKAETVRPGFISRIAQLVDADIRASTARLLFSQMATLAGISEINDEAGQGPVQK